MEWTTKAPNKTGWYWTWDTDFVTLVMVWWETDAGTYATTSDGERWLLDDFTHWQGPISQPAPPVDT